MSDAIRYRNERLTLVTIEALQEALLANVDTDRDEHLNDQAIQCSRGPLDACATCRALKLYFEWHKQLG